MSAHQAGEVPIADRLQSFLNECPVTNIGVQTDAVWRNIPIRQLVEDALQALRPPSAEQPGEPVAELREVYEACRSFLRYNGIDRERVNQAIEDMANAVEKAKIIDGGGDLQDTVFARPPAAAKLAEEERSECLKALAIKRRTSVSMLEEILTDEGRDGYKEVEHALWAWQARASLSAGTAAPDGWQLVPKEPTPGMLNAWAKFSLTLRDAYVHMLAAAPSAEPGATAQPERRGK